MRRAVLNRASVSRVLDAAILVVTLLYGLVFVFVEVFAKDSASVFQRVDLAFSIALVAGLGAQFLLAADKRRWLAQNWVDVIVIVFIVFPILRILRVSRYVLMGYAARLARHAVIMGEGLRAHLRSTGGGTSTISS